MEQNAEAHRPRKGRRKAGTKIGLLIRPRKGGLDLMDARKRRLVDLRGSPLRVDRLATELESRHSLESRTRKKRRRMTSTETVRWKDSQEVFGMRWQLK